MDHDLRDLDGLVDAVQAAWPAPQAVTVVGARHEAARALLAGGERPVSSQPTLDVPAAPGESLVLLPDQLDADAVALLERLSERPVAGVLVGRPHRAPTRRLDRLDVLETVARRVGWATSHPQPGWLLLTPAAEGSRSFRWVTADSSALMRGQFEAIFGHAMSEPLWQWKYGGGHGVGLGLWSDGELVAHYGGLVREVLAFGRPLRACQVCDVMVSPRARAALARRGPLAQITSTFLEHQIGWELPCRIGFGFPSDRHFGVARHLGLYEGVDEMLLLAWPVAPSQRRGSGPWRVEPVDAHALQPGAPAALAADRLWAVMARDFADGVIGVRDAAWLRHRYLQRPDAEYRLWALRSPVLGRWGGFFVTRDHGTHTELLDLLGPVQRFPALLAAARQVAAGTGAPYVHAWITASHLRWLHHPGDDGLRPAPQNLGIRVPANAHTPGPSPADYVGRWFLMSGDTDFR